MGNVQGPPAGGNRTVTSADAPREHSTRDRAGAKVLRFPFAPDTPEFEAAKRVAARFEAHAALEVASGVVLIAGMKLSPSRQLPPLLARALYDATRRLRDAAALAALREADPDEYDRREAEYLANPTAEAVTELAARPARCPHCGDPFTARWPRCPGCGRCGYVCCTCAEARP